MVGIPIYFHAVLAEQAGMDERAAFFLIGTFMAVWVILYGGVQAAAPRLLRAARLLVCIGPRQGQRGHFGCGSGRYRGSVRPCRR